MRVRSTYEPAMTKNSRKASSVSDVMCSRAKNISAHRAAPTLSAMDIATG